MSRQDDDVVNDDENSSWTNLPLPALVAAVTLWAVCVTAEERFLPCLQAVCDAWHIPSSVAGPTLLSMGSASPNLLAVFVSVFFSSGEGGGLGLGTIVGSNMFQCLAVVAAAVLSSRQGQQIQLAPATTMRELGFLTVAVSLLGYSLMDHVESSSSSSSSNNENDTISAIYIHRHHSLWLLAAYVLYVMVCANFECITNWYLWTTITTTAVTTPSSSNNTTQWRWTRHKLEHEPSGNFGDPRSGALPSPADEVLDINLSDSDSVRDNDKYHNMALSTPVERNVSSDVESSEGLEISLSDNVDGGDHKKGWQRIAYLGKRVLWSTWTLAKRQEPGLEDMVETTAAMSLSSFGGDGQPTNLSCHLWQWPHRFHHQVPLVARHNDWQKRWFTFGADGTVSSVTFNRKKQRCGRLDYPAFGSVQADLRHLLLRIQAAVPDGPEYILMAPNKQILTRVLERLHFCHLLHSPLQIGSIDNARTATELQTEAIQAEQEARPSLIDFPHGAAFPVMLIHIVLFPLKFVLHYTMPDVRSATTTSIGSYCQLSTWVLMWALLASTFWLVVNSLIMVMSLERVGAILRIPDAVIGITVSAIGTSVPIFIASSVAAKQGLGNMAVGNAISSSTFNILVGLGLPWFLYTSFVSDTYHDLSNEGMVQAMAWMIGSLVFVILLVLTSGFRLCRWHAMVLTLTYVVYLTYTIVGFQRVS